jgi:uncharacterized protein involved in exopolysaccharide biosynthesis
MEQRSLLTVRDALHVVFKRKWLIVLFFLSTCVTVGAVAIAVEQPMFEATTQILLRPGREHIADVTLPMPLTLPPRLSFDLDEQSARTIELLTGRYLVEQVVQAVGARELCYTGTHALFATWAEFYCDPTVKDSALFDGMVARVRNNIHAQRLTTAALVSLSFRHPNPEAAAKVVEKLGSLYLEHYLGVLNSPRTQAFLEDQFAVVQARLAQAEKEMDAFKANNTITSTVKEENETARRQLATLELEHDEALAHEADTKNRVGRLEDELANHGTLNRRVQEELQQAQTELSGLRARRQVQEAKLAELRQRIRKLDVLEPKFVHLQQRAELERQNFAAYMTKAEEARISSAMDTEKISSFKIIEPVRKPSQALQSKLGQKLALAVLFGALGALIIAFGLEFFSDRMDTAERAQAVLGLPVLVSIPHLPPQLR